MKRSNIMRTLAATAAILALSAADSWAHCDTMNGPVVKAARQALTQGDVRFALVWVRPADEGEIRAAFAKAMTVRALGGEARSLADRYFFEALVRVHRAGEGAPYTGLKEGDVQPEPAIAAAEKALQANSAKTLSEDLGSALHKAVSDAFERVQVARKYQAGNVDAGRRFVGAYVSYIHYVERLYGAVASQGDAHGAPAEVHVH